MKKFTGHKMQISLLSNFVQNIYRPVELLVRHHMRRLSLRCAQKSMYACKVSAAIVEFSPKLDWINKC
jgi:hypothetical protein